MQWSLFTGFLANDQDDVHRNSGDNNGKDCDNANSGIYLNGRRNPVRPRPPGCLAAAAMKADGYYNAFSLRDDDGGGNNGGFSFSSLVGPMAALSRDFTYCKDWIVENDMRTKLGMDGQFASQSCGGSMRYKYLVFHVIEVQVLCILGGGLGGANWLHRGDCGVSEALQEQEEATRLGGGAGAD